MYRHRRNRRPPLPLRPLRYPRRLRRLRRRTTTLNCAIDGRITCSRRTSSIRACLDKIENNIEENQDAIIVVLKRILAYY